MSEQDNISLFDHEGRKRIPEDKLMAYLEGRLSAAEQHEVEEWLAEEGMESDAIEGLKALETTQTRQSVGKLNHQLRKEVAGKRKRRRPLDTGNLTWIAIGLILVLAVACYAIVRIKAGQQQHTQQPR